jgi:hypothetical protein
MQHRSIQTTDVQKSNKNNLHVFHDFFLCWSFTSESLHTVSKLLKSCIYRCGLVFCFWFYKHNMKAHRYVVRLDLSACFVFCLLYDQILMFLWYVLVHGFHVTLVPEMLDLTILDKWSVQLSSGVFNCKSPGDGRLCHFLDYIIWYNLLMIIVTLVTMIKLCLLNMIFFLKSLNLPLQTLKCHEIASSCLVHCLCHLTSLMGRCIVN